MAISAINLISRKGDNMTEPRTRTRGGAPTTPAQTQGDDWWKEGDDGFQTAETLQSNKKWQSPRFYLKVDESAEIVILDDGKGFFIHEYEIYDPAKKRTSYETVRKDVDHDPLEQLVGVDPRFKDAAYIMYLSCIDLRPFTGKNGEQRYYAKKLLPVKRAQMKKFKRWIEQYGTLRGLMLRMNRDDPKGAKIGDPELNPIDGKTHLTEEDMIENFGHAALMSQDGKSVLKEENADCYAFDYRTTLAPSPPEELAKRWGAPYNPGSAQANSQMSQQAAATSRLRTAATPPPLAQRLKTGGAPAPKEEVAEEVEKPKTSTLIKSRSAPKEAVEEEPKKTLVTKPAAAPVEKDDIPFDTDEETSEEWYGDQDE